MRPLFIALISAALFVTMAVAGCPRHTSVEEQERLLRACATACNNHVGDFSYEPDQLKCRCVDGYLIDVE